MDLETDADEHDRESVEEQKRNVGINFVPR